MRRMLVLLVSLGLAGCAGFVSYPYNNYPYDPYGPQFYQGYSEQVVLSDREFPERGGAFYGVEHGRQIKNYSDRGKVSRNGSGSGGHTSAGRTSGGGVQASAGRTSSSGVQASAPKTSSSGGHAGAGAHGGGSRK
jgi:hypothetical protein